VSIIAKRVVSAVLATAAIITGGWAVAGPRSFFLSFPLPGHHWVAALPPYNEHLTRDVGSLFLALAVVSVWAAARPRPDTFVMVGVAWEAFSIPHLAYHSAHLDMFSTADAIGNAVSLSGIVVLAALLLVPARRRAA
jgi:hypothetical protein